MLQIPERNIKIDIFSGICNIIQGMESVRNSNQKKLKEGDKRKRNLAKII